MVTDTTNVSKVAITCSLTQRRHTTILTPNHPALFYAALGHAGMRFDYAVPCWQADNDFGPSHSSDRDPDEP